MNTTLPFIRKRKDPIILSIAGSDSGGAAGIQADLKTFAALGVFGTSAITCVTAQNPSSIKGICCIKPNIVKLQIKTVYDAFPIAAVKTGMLFNANIIKTVAATAGMLKLPNLVVDPVMISTSGTRLLQKRAITVLKSVLLPIASIITPNLYEAEVLAELNIKSLESMRQAAIKIGIHYNTACVVKGGHLPGREAIDVLFYRGRVQYMRMPRHAAAKTHGTGCVFSSAIAAFLGRGNTIPRAVWLAKQFVNSVLKQKR